MKFDIKDYELGSRPLWAVAASVFILLCLVFFIFNSVAFGKGEHLLPIYSVETPDKKVAITFNCAWGGEDIPEILALLEKYGAKATFFVLGQWAVDNPNCVAAISAAGHEIGNHSNTHPDMAKLSPDKIKAELSRCDGHILAAGGEKPALFRAPSGSYSDTLIKTAMEEGYIPIQWDIDSRDWKGYSEEKMVAAVTKHTQKGSIILFHTGKETTLAALPHILENLSNAGYEFVTVGELIYKDNYSIDRAGRQHSLQS